MAFEKETGGSMPLPPQYTAAPSPQPTQPTTTTPAAPHSNVPQYNVTQATFPGVPAVLAGDWSYQQLLSLDKAMSGEDQARMNRNISQMTGYYGSDQDPLSLLGRIFTAYGDRNRTIGNTLAGHGMLGSGETKFQADKSTLAYQQQEYDAKFKLQQYIQGMQDAFADAERNRKLSELAGAQNAITGWLQDPANQPVVVPNPDYSPNDPVVTTPAAPATSFSWGGQTWTKGDQAAFTQWLNSRGVKYSTWAAAHPGAAALL